MSAIDPQSQVRRAPDAVDGIKYLAISKSYCRDQEIYGVNDPADFWYRIVSGAARKCLVLIDGRRRIVDFLLPDEFFGFGTRQRHSFYVEAIVKGTVVACYPRRNVQMIADSDSRLSRWLLEVAFEAISSSQARIQILGRVNALEKVSSFLVEMHQRLAKNAGDPIVLPMSRYDIGDYLAISTETVSRALTDLTKRGAITLVGKRRIEIANRVMLDACTD